MIARGVPRLTRDIDIAIAGADLSVGDLVNELSRAGIEPQIKDALAFAEENQVLLARHRESGVDVDVSRAWLPFEIEALAAANLESLGGVLSISIAQPKIHHLQSDRLAATGPAGRRAASRPPWKPGRPPTREAPREGAGDAQFEVDRLRDLNDLVARVVKR